MHNIIIGRSKSDLEAFGEAGTILLGKHYIKMGQTTSLSNSIYMDITRAHVVFICGKRGGGKCLDGETLITLDDGSQVPIRELADRKGDIICLNPTLKMQSAPKEEFFSRTVNRMLAVRLRSGKQIRLTPEHPLLTVKGWMPAEQLHIGSRIATPRKLEAFGRDSLGEEKTKLIAYLAAEGHLSNGFVLFSNTDSAIIDDFSMAVRQFDPSLVIKEHSKPGCYRIIQHNKRSVTGGRNAQGQFADPIFDAQSSLRKWLGTIGMYGKLAYERTLPDAVFTLPKTETSLLLNRLFSCDGCIHSEGSYWKVSYSSSSETMIHQVQHLLLRFGVLSSIRRKETARRPNYELLVRGESVHTYLSEIGFFGKKHERATKALKEVVSIVRNPNTDTIPKEIWDIYRPDNWAAVGRALGYAHPKALVESTHYAPSRQKLLQIAKADDDLMLEQLATADIFWDEIVALEELSGEFTVYDISVPNYHNFVANDIIVHNSYTMGVIAEGLSDLPREIAQNISIILLDTMGIYWTMKYPNKKDEPLLNQWGMKAHGLDINIYTPYGYFEEYQRQGIPTDNAFSIPTKDMSAADWCLSFGVQQVSPLGVIIQRATDMLQEADEPFDLDDLIKVVQKIDRCDEHVRDAAINFFTGAKSWGLFTKEGTPLETLAKGGQVTVLDVSCYATMPNGWEIKSLAVGLVSQKLFNERMRQRKQEEFEQIHSAMYYFSEDDVKEQQQYPLVWLVIDEAHEFLPNDRTTTATSALVTILREGRQPGISLILATQQPGKIHTDVMTQSDTVIAHRITAKVDTEALGTLMQSYMRKGLTEQLDDLPRDKGGAIVFDDNNEKMYPMRVRPRFTWHGGESPSAIPRKKKMDL